MSALHLSAGQAKNEADACPELWIRLHSQTKTAGNTGEGNDHIAAFPREKFTQSATQVNGLVT